MPSAATVRLSAQLWQRAGDGDRFPRDIEALCAWTLPLGIVSLPVLWTAEVARRLAEFGVASGSGPQWRLRACLVARNGEGLVFVDGSDPPDERRFSLAHEAAHFLIECLLPRQRLAARLGGDALEAYDGRRSATTQERIDALLGGVELRPRLHLMERDASGLACGTVAGAECAADELAIELVAPEAVVLERFELRNAGVRAEGREAALRSLLSHEFGLPASVAEPYARHLCHTALGPLSTAEWLGLRRLPSPLAGEGPGMRGERRDAPTGAMNRAATECGTGPGMRGERRDAPTGAMNRAATECGTGTGMRGDVRGC